MIETKLKCLNQSKLIIEASVNFNTQGQFELRYSWNDELTNFILKSGECKKLNRKMSLWEDHCLEFFISKEGNEKYYEFNFSITEDYWNCFSLSGYRTDLKETYDFEIVSKKFFLECEKLTISFIIEPIEEGLDFLARGNFFVNQAAIILDNEKKPQFWAYNHLNGKADFHRKETYMPFGKLISGV